MEDWVKVVGIELICIMIDLYLSWIDIFLWVFVLLKVVNVVVFEGVDEVEELLWERFLRGFFKFMDLFFLFLIVWVFVFFFLG